VFGVFLALLASASWGTSDLLGGLQTRRFGALPVLLVSQPVGFVLAWGVALAFGDAGLTDTEFLVGALGGASVLLALGAFYKAMALGSISVVSMIGALGVLGPIIVSIAQGDNLSALEWAGCVVAVSGVILVAREGDVEWRHANRTAMGLAAAAALGFGAFFVCLDYAADADPAWTIAAARTGGVVILAAWALAVRPTLPRARGGVLAGLLVIGVLDVTANSLYAVATTHGPLALVAVGGSLYSAVTILLARIFLGERLQRVQRIGMVAALVGIALIAAGGA
jgi:drug/metabolite transporter (DMT)-like permease